MLLGFATGPSLNQAEPQPVKLNQNANNYRRQQMLNGQYIKMSINGVSMICGVGSTLFHQ
jgi:hypothetical protein